MSADTAVDRRATSAPRRWWASTPLGGFRPSPQSDLRTHALVLAFSVLALVTALQRMVGYRHLSRPLATDPLWPVAWARALPWSSVAITLTLALLAAAVVATIGYRHRPARLVLAALALVYVAAVSSFGKINHGLHHFVLVAVVIGFVPSLGAAGGPGRPSVPRRAYDLVAAAQGLVLVTYTLSGASKLIVGIAQVRAGEPSMFGSGSLGRLVADRMLQTGEAPPLASVAIDHPALGAVLFGATVLIELLAVAVLPFPRVAAGWAVLLAGFHVAVFWAMHINFSVSIAVLVLLFGLSPFLAPPGGPDGQEDMGPPGSLRGSVVRPTTG